MQIWIKLTSEPEIWNKAMGESLTLWNFSICYGIFFCYKICAWMAMFSKIFIKYIKEHNRIINISIKFTPLASTADLGRIILIGVLSTLGIIVLLLILLAAAYFWWRHKRSQLEFVEPTDENETSSGSLKFQQLLESQQQEQLLLEQQKQLQQQQKEAGAQPNNINRKLNGFLNLKTPLIGWVFLPALVWIFHKLFFIFVPNTMIIFL